MSEQQTSYRQVMKATSIFGGVQVFNILIGILRSKFIAVLLGPTGMGVFGLLSSTVGMIASLTNFGLETSAVKDLSAASGNEIRISILAKVIRRLVWITGFLGVMVTLVFSSWLSQVTFGNKEYTWGFVWLSITLLLNQINIGQTVLLRGMRQLKFMAQAGMLGSLFGLITTVPLYYFYGTKGIIPGMIVTAVIMLLLTSHYATKIEIKSLYVSKARTLAESKEMVKMGFMISLSGMITIGASYLVRIYISNVGGVDQVGLYYAGFAIITTYVGLIFTAMGTDYYPRLAGVASNNKQCNVVINQQAEIALLILAPVILLFLVFSNWAVILLYSAKFAPINDMILWAALGMFFKAASWAIAFIFLAKGASKLFFVSELITNIYLLAFNLLGYKFGGLTGLGISFLVSYFLYLIQVFVIARMKYDFSFSNEFSKIFGCQVVLATFCFVFMKFLSAPFSYILGISLIIISVIYSFTELDKRLGIKSIIENIKKFKFDK
jgi:Membrane protein involved in the export of O-antigen and teichoic acid